jgi:hypothetical protein
MPDFTLDFATLHPEIRDITSPIASDPAIRALIEGAGRSGGAGGATSTPEKSWIEKAMDAVRGYEQKLQEATGWLATGTDSFELTPSVTLSKGDDGGIDSAAILGMSIGSQTITTATSGIVDAANKSPQMQRMIAQKQ